jgi:hypothetical protein
VEVALEDGGVKAGAVGLSDFAGGGVDLSVTSDAPLEGASMTRVEGDEGNKGIGRKEGREQGRKEGS